MKKNDKTIEKILKSRAGLAETNICVRKSAEEGGCGVTGFICSIPVRGSHIYEPSVQMHNRGNGKGGGIAAVGLSADDLGITQDVLDSHYLLQIALLDPDSLKDVEETNILPFFDIHSGGLIPTIDDYREIEELEVKPPDVVRYFVRIKNDVLDRFIEKNDLSDFDPKKAEDEFIYQNTVGLNRKFYSSLGKQKAFVLSHGKNLMILKIVGYAEKVVQYYRLEDFKAHGWIAHQRYPTKGKVWHPGGAHPFSGLHEAIVHNGDFANYHSVSEYLYQHNIYPQFLTDTEVSALLLDLLNRTFEYPMEYIIEAIAPTTEHDFDQLSEEKQRIYRYIQSAHINASPDGPWFFIIARNNPYENFFQLIGITDTSMLRPQVFALFDGEVQIGLICSEKQAIDATLKNLAEEDDRFCPVADIYWNARGGSSTDGGSFMFTVKDSGKNDGSKTLVCTNKFGEPVTVPKSVEKTVSVISASHENPSDIIENLMRTSDMPALKKYCEKYIETKDYESVSSLSESIVSMSEKNDYLKTKLIEILTHLNDNRFSCGGKKRSIILNFIRKSLAKIFGSSLPLNEKENEGIYRYIDFKKRNTIRSPLNNESILVVNAEDFQPEGDDCDSRLICEAYKLGWKRFICYGYKGQRFCGCGLSSNSNEVRIDVYGSSGDYLASGIDGLEIYVHDNAQDQLGQIMKNGKLVVYGDVGQTFMYGAKGGEVFVMGNAAGRPLINAVGRPRVVMNRTCLDYLAESFMAGDPLSGGGFVVLNGVEFDYDGRVVPLPNPYPGSNLFSLASGGAIYVRDPFFKIADGQLNQGKLTKSTANDWELILPYLKENERLFGISIKNDLLTVDGAKKDYSEVYRKVSPLV